jgi:hypothetical protein
MTENNTFPSELNLEYDVLGDQIPKLASSYKRILEFPIETQCSTTNTKITFAKDKAEYIDDE